MYKLSFEIIKDEDGNPIRKRKEKNNISNELKLQIIKEHEEGVTFKKLEEKYNVSDSAIVNYYKKYREKGEEAFIDNDKKSRGKEGGRFSKFWNTNKIKFIYTDVRIPLCLFLYIQESNKDFSEYIFSLLFKNYNVKNYDDILEQLENKYKSNNEDLLIEYLENELQKFPVRIRGKSFWSAKEIIHFKKPSIKPPSLIWNYFHLKANENNKSLNNQIIELIFKNLNFKDYKEFFDNMLIKYKCNNEESLIKKLQVLK